MPETPSAALPRGGPVPDHVQSQDLPIPANVTLSGTTAQADLIDHSSTDQPPRQKKTAKSKKDVVCRYWATKNGCRAGEACPYLHENATAGGHNPQSRFPNKGTKFQGNDAAATVPQPLAEHQDTGGPASLSNLPKTPVQQQRTIVERPIPKAEATNPRDFQIGQINRRYSPTRTDDAYGTTLVFQLQPSDPDFPFELRHGLACKLVVPKDFPGDTKPTLRVSNAEMARGYQINVERGFDSLVDQHPHLTLLKLMNDLDKNLETFLTAQKAETVKISVNANKPVGPTQPPAAPLIVPMPAAPAPRESAFSDEQKVEAQAKRKSEVRQLEARMGKMPLFSKSADGTSFKIPLQIPKPTRLPPSLQSLKDVTLLVPMLYDLEPCSIAIKSVDSPDSHNVEKSFAKKAREQSQLSLMAHINALSQNMHVMAEETESDPVKEPVQVDNSIPTEKVVAEPTALQATPVPSSTEGKSHIVVIPRPPEWSAPDDDLSGDDEDSSEEYESDEDPTDEDEDGGAPVPADAIEQASTGPDLGISLSFPFIELYGIELLKLSVISVTLKCDRCKTLADIKNLQPAQTKTESCAKCANLLSIGYRSELMHSNTIRAGYIDLDGCTIADLLPSTFVPTCSTCSTDYKAGTISVRGESTLAVCRECHAKMSFRIPEVKFLRISAGSSTKDRGLPRKRPKENLGITAGQELPRRGRCQHYGKSYRWFRFSCCNKVYACDRCHDEVEEHPNEHANRMICGWCSREQIYRPEDCAHCHSGLIGKKGGGFWEGGKGTRDKNRMSRKDPRKYKRRGGSKVGK